MWLLGRAQWPGAAGGCGGVIGCFEVGGQLAQGLSGAVHDFRAGSGGALSLAIRADPAHLSTR